MKSTLYILAGIFLPIIATAESYTPLVSDGPFNGALASTSDELLVGTFIQQLFTWSIGIASVLAVAMIIVGGFQYMQAAGGQNTKQAKERIQGAVGGLVLLIASVFILNLINPTLTNLDVALQ